MIALHEAEEKKAAHPLLFKWYKAYNTQHALLHTGPITIQLQQNLQVATIISSYLLQTSILKSILII